MEDEEKKEVTNNEETQQVTEQNEELKFTQSDFNEALKKEVARKTNGMSKEELKQFRQWKESQQSNQNNEGKDKEEKKPEDEILEKSKREDINEQNAIKEVKVLKSGVNPEFSDFVTYEVSKMEGDFSKNLAKFLKDNPKYLTSNDNTKFVKKIGSSLNLEGSKPLQTTNQKMNDLIRSARD